MTSEAPTGVVFAMHVTPLEPWIIGDVERWANADSAFIDQRLDEHPTVPVDASREFDERAYDPDADDVRHFKTAVWVGPDPERLREEARWWCIGQVEQARLILAARQRNSK